MKHSQKVIDFAVFLASQEDPAFSSRDISQRILEKFSVHVTHVTVAKWISPSPMQSVTMVTQIIGESVERRLTLDSVFDIPCFRCFWKDPLKARRCKPENCDELAEWLEGLVEWPPTPQYLETLT